MPKGRCSVVAIIFRQKSDTVCPRIVDTKIFGMTLIMIWLNAFSSESYLCQLFICGWVNSLPIKGNTLQSYFRYLRRWSIMDKKVPGPRFNIKTAFPGMEISIMKLIWSWDRLIFIMGIPLLVRQCLCTQRPPGRRLPEDHCYQIRCFTG